MGVPLIILACVGGYFLVGYLVLLSYRIINPSGFRNDLKNDTESLKLLFLLWILMAIAFPIFTFCEFWVEKVRPKLSKHDLSLKHLVFFISDKETKEKKIDLLEKTSQDVAQQ